MICSSWWFLNLPLSHFGVRSRFGLTERANWCDWCGRFVHRFLQILRANRAQSTPAEAMGNCGNVKWMKRRVDSGRSWMENGLSFIAGRWTRRGLVNLRRWPVKTWKIGEKGRKGLPGWQQQITAHRFSFVRLCLCACLFVSNPAGRIYNFAEFKYIFN